MHEGENETLFQQVVGKGVTDMLLNLYLCRYAPIVVHDVAEHIVYGLHKQVAILTTAFVVTAAKGFSDDSAAGGVPYFVCPNAGTIFHFERQ